MQNTMYRTIQNLLISILLLTGTVNVLAQATTPDQLVQTVLQDVISDIQKASKGSNWNQQAAINLIEKKVTPHFDFTRMTSLAIGRPWRDATNDQKAALVKEFHRMIVRTYANTVTSYQNETFDIKPLPTSEAAKNATTVRGQINRSQGDAVKIDISVIKNGNTWKVYDVVVAGVSIVMNFRGTFNTEIQKNSIDGLIKMLADKNNKNEDIQVK